MREAIVTGVISGVVSGIILFFLYLLWQWVMIWCTSEELKIVLEKLPENILTKGFKFGVLYVQDEDETIRNTVHWFEKKGTDELHAIIRHPRNLGFQYKCFVDNYLDEKFSQEDFDQITVDLGPRYNETSFDSDKRHRIWFILSEKSKAKDYRGNENNYHYPV